MSHLFEKFYRGAAATDAGIRGTGLGLVLVKQAVDAHGGAISVESELGQGARFTITLPLGDEAGISLASDRSATLPLFQSLAV